MDRRKRAQNPEKIESPACQFDAIAFLYDELMLGVPYREWVNYLVSLIARHGGSPKTVLDLCCGTGNATRILAERGYDVTGVDISPEMIEYARKKSADQIDYYVQDAVKLSLGRKFDLVVSLFDSLNYILDASDLQQAFHRISQHMHEGSLFIFDMNTELALSIGLFNQSNFENERARVRYNWRSSYDASSRICRVQMDFMYKEERVEIVHHQRAYMNEEVAEMLNTSGLTPLAAYDAYTFKNVSKKSDRVFFVAQK
jgi:SAM-dependent methyltransferase